LLPFLGAGWAAALLVAAFRRAPDARSRLARILPLPLPTLVLFLPLAAEQARHGSLLGVFADPGPVPAPAPAPHLLGVPAQLTTVLQLATGWPAWAESAWRALTQPLGLSESSSVLFVWALALPLLLLAAVGLFWPRRSMPIRVGIAGAGGLIVAVLATRLQVAASGATPVPGWPGAGLSIAWLGVLEAAICGLDRLAATGELPFGDRVAAAAAHLRAASAAFIGFTAVAAVLAAVSPLLVATLLGTASVRPSTQATVPAIVAAEAADRPGLGLLTLTPQPDGGVREKLTRGSGQTLEELSTLESTADFGHGSALAELSAALVQPTGEDLGARLRGLQIGYVLLAPGAGDAVTAAAGADARAALGANPLFTTVANGASGTLYRYDGLPVSAGRSLDAVGPSNTATAIGSAVLLVQALVLGVFGLLALPTRRIAVRMRPEPPGRAPRADVDSTHAAARRPLAPEQVMARELTITPPPPPTSASRPLEMREEVGAWR
jgi:hypothetical protein